GSRTPWGGWTGTFAAQPTRIVGAGLRWAPWMIAYTGGFADSTCTQPAATKAGHDARCPLEGALEFPPTLDDGVILHTITSVIDTVYEPGPPCTGRRVDTDIAVAIGGPMPIDEMPAAGEVVVGDGAVRVHYATFDGQAIIATAANGQLGGN